MRRMTCFVMALALVLGLAQCKKEQPVEPTSESNSLMITLDVKGDNNAKADVNPPQVTFENGDEIVVTCNGHYVGTLKKTTDEEGVSKFRGSITNATEGKPLYFYFFGNATPQYFGENKYNCTVYIGDQTGDLPVISMGPSINPETGAIVNFEENGVRSFSARLHNKCSLMKFNVTANTEAPICINGMNNFIEIDYTKAANDNEYNGFSYSQVYNGEIKMKGQEGSGTKTYWAIVLPQTSVAEGGAFTEDHTNIGTRPEIAGGIGLNQYYSDGIDISMISYDPLGTPLTFEAKTAGATVKLSKAGTQLSQAPKVYLEISTDDGDTWEDYTLSDEISLTNVGDKVMFRATETNDKFAKDLQAYNKFSISGACYVYGNIMSLIDADYEEHDSFGDDETDPVNYIFASLFQGCTGLYNHPQKTLELPSTTLGSYCYAQMFWGCTNLTKAPELESDDLQTGCYQSMFEGCTSLTATPVLWAEDLVSNCYASMFSGCTSLSRVTCLATTTNSTTGTGNWLSNVAERGTFIMSSSAASLNFWNSGDSGIPADWAVENY